MTRRSVLVLVAFLSMSASAFAQEGPARSPSATPTATQVVSFTDELVQSQLQVPDGVRGFVRRRGQAISLLRIRENFVSELFKSAENI
jgi:hypothetical protein